jgi:uncharacterized protein with HEPN domain
MPSVNLCAKRSCKRRFRYEKGSDPQIPWRNIAGFRNILVHDYLGIKLQRIWEIIEVDLRLLKATLNQAIGEKKNKKI